MYVCPSLFVGLGSLLPAVECYLDSFLSYAVDGNFSDTVKLYMFLVVFGNFSRNNQIDKERSEVVPKQEN